jgi:hypothetical protein
MHVKDEDFAALHTSEPKLVPIVSETAVMRFVSPSDLSACE